jgi:polyphosphate kinase
MGNVNDLLRSRLLPDLHQAGIHIYDYDELSQEQQQAANAYFTNFIFPVYFIQRK